MKNLFVENQPGRNRHVPAATFATARPLAEGAAQPAARQKRREWSRMDNDAVIACASGTIRKKGITSITGLENEDSGLVRIIRLRGIEGMLPLGLKRADWKGAGDDELLAKARALMAERGIKTSSDFRRAEPKLHCALAHRRLLGKAGFAAAYRDWGAMSPDEIVSHAAAFMKERGIRIQAELRKADYGLWNALNRRKLLGRMPFEPGRREWGKVGHDELAAAASEFMESEGITTRNALKNSDPGLYCALESRGILDRLHFKQVRRSWGGTGDGQLIKAGWKLITQHGLPGKDAMRSVDAGLHAALRRRGLLDFAWMSDAALLNNAGRMMEFGAIVDAHALKGTQPVLYAALCKRGLLEGLCLQKEEGQDAAGTVAGRTAAVISP